MAFEEKRELGRFETAIDTGPSQVTCFSRKLRINNRGAEKKQ